MSAATPLDTRAAFWITKGVEDDLARLHVARAHAALNTVRPPPVRREVEMSKMHALYLSKDLSAIAPVLTKMAIEAGELQPHQKFQDLVRKLLFALSESCSKNGRFVFPV